MTTIILAVLVLVAWVDLARRYHRIWNVNIALAELISAFGRDIMNAATDITTKLESVVSSLTAISGSVNNLSDDVTTLKQMIADATNPDGISAADAQALLDKATQLEAAASALASSAQTAADLFPTPPPIEPTA